jgi:subtilisin family serine protease
VQLIGVQVTGVTETTATIEWTTDVAADSQVEYGPTTDYGLLTPPDPALTTVHSVTVGGLEPGATYHFRARSRPAGQAPAASQDFTVTTAVPTGTLAGVAFDDLDGDGVREAGEPGLAGWTIVLDLHDDATVDATTVTDAAGAYAFAGVAAGTHAVREAPQAGWTQTAPPAAATAATALTASAAALFTPAEAVGDGLAPMAASVAGEGLTNLAAFRADPRFAGIDGRGMAAVVIDTGIDVDHPFFGPDGDGDGVADRIVFQYDFADRDADASDRDGHGSSMASILASQDASVGGIAPAVDLIVLKVFADATRQASFAYLEQALQWVIAHVDTYDIAVVNLSLGDGGNWSTAAPRYGIDDELAALADHDIVVAAPAGNGFYTAAGVPGVAYPAADPNALAIGAVWAGDFGGPWTSSGGATDLTTGPDRIASFSQRHATLTDVFAPGARLVGANQAGGTVTLQGTSQATAYVSGATVLAQQVAEQALGRRLTVAEVTDLLRRTGDPIVDGDDENDNVTNTGLTFARLDVLALADGILALDAVDPDPSAEPGATAAPHVVTLAPGQARGDVDFGNFRLAEIRGSVFHDLDLDGAPAAAEPFLAGWTVFLDANANGQRDPLESVSVTDGQGRYAFTGVGPGRVRTVQVVPPLWAPTAAPAPGEIVVTSGLVVSGRDFGAVRITLDVDGNGTAEALTDGRVLYRLLSGVDDARLVAGSVIAPGAVRPAPATIRAYVDAAASLTPSMPDADGDGAATIADATIILRYLAGAPPAQLLTGLTLGAGATRTTAAAIVDHLDDFLPAAAVPADATGAAAPIATVTETPDGAAASADAPTEDPSAEAPVWHAVRMEGAPALSRSIVEPGVVVAPPALRAQRGPDLVVDWSRSWEGGRHRRDPGTRREPSWVAPLLLDLQEEDPNRALQVVLADRYPNSIPA